MSIKAYNFFFATCLFLSACQRNPVVVNELLLEKISKGLYKESQIKIDSIFDGRWDTFILMPPYFLPDSLSNCGVEKDIITKIIRHSPFQTDIENLRIYFTYSNKVYSINNFKGLYMLLELTNKGCTIIKKGDFLSIENIAKDSLYIDFRLYKK